MSIYHTWLLKYYKLGLIWRLPQLLGQLEYLDYPGSVDQLAVEYDFDKSSMG